MASSETTLIIIAFLACVISTYSEGRLVLVPSPPGRALDKAALERFLKNPDQWFSVDLDIDYFDPSGVNHGIFVRLGNEEQSVDYKILYNYAEGTAVDKTVPFPEGLKAFVSDVVSAELPDREIALSLLRSEAVGDLFTRKLPCSVCEKGWIYSNHGELYKKGNEYFSLHISFLSKERGWVEFEGHRVEGFIHCTGVRASRRIFEAEERGRTESPASGAGNHQIREGEVHGLRAERTTGARRNTANRRLCRRSQANNPFPGAGNASPSGKRSLPFVLVV